MCVIPSDHGSASRGSASGGGSASRGQGLHPGWDLRPGGSASGAETPSDTIGYSQHAGGTHPTGMHSSFVKVIDLVAMNEKFSMVPQLVK